MKKLVFIVAAILALVSCQKEEKTTYTVNIQIGYQEAAQTQGINYTADIMINEYGGGKKLNTQRAENINEGVDYVFTPNSKTEYLTVKYTCRVGSQSTSFWIGKTYDIIRGQNTSINILYTTIAVTNEPKK